jgi:integrase
VRGHVRQRGRTWAVVVDKGRDPETGKRKQKWVGGFVTKGDAEDHLVDLLGKLKRGERIDPDLTPLQDYVTAWIDGREGLAPLSLTQYRSVTKNHIANTTLGRTPIGKIRRADVRAFDKALRDKGLALATRRVVRAVLSRSLADATADDLINGNPCRDAFSRGEGTRSPRKFTAWTASELRDLLAAAEGDRLEALWRLQVTCGLRRGESLGLTWRGFDEANKTLEVTQQVVPTRGGCSLAPCKTAGSHRTLSLDGETVRVLREHRERQKVERALAGDAYSDRDLIFCDELGGLLGPPAVTRRFATLRAAAKIRPGRLHDLRHSHATHLLASGVPVGTVSARLGHSSPVVTLTVYAHVIPNSDKAAVEALAAALVG